MAVFTCTFSFHIKLGFYQRIYTHKIKSIHLNAHSKGQKGHVKLSVIIVDAPCGAGKSTFAIQSMNEQTDKSFCYCTPFLSEIDRIIESCKQAKFKQPLPYGHSKLDDFNSLLAANENVAVTHVNFLNANDDTINALRENEYTLICDEALDIVADFNSIQAVKSSPRQAISKDDIRFLIDRGIIEISKDNRVIWRGGNTGEDFKFGEVRQMAELNRLFCINNVFFVVIFPPEIFSAFKEVIILTYQFDGSLMKYYFDMFSIAYSKASIVKRDNKYIMVPYSADADNAFRAQCRELITICNDRRLNSQKRSLSNSWFKNANGDSLSELKSNLTAFFERYAPKSTAADRMWTTYRDFVPNLKGRGYTVTRQITKKEKSESKDLDRLLDEVSCYVPCNARSTNTFRNRWVLAYVCNLYVSPFIKGFFTDAGITFDDDAFALSNLIQWICRSRLRDGKPIVLYLPSARERKLLNGFMEGGVPSDAQKVQLN